MIQDAVSGLYKEKENSFTKKVKLDDIQKDSETVDSDATIDYCPQDWMESDVEPLSILRPGKSAPKQPKHSIGTLKVKFFGLSKKVKSQRIYTCPICGNRSTKVMDFNVHYRTSHPAVQCDIYHKTFATPSLLKHHAYNHQVRDKKCPKCGKTFIFNSQLTAHLKTHRKLKPYVCSFMTNGVRCRKDFNYIGDLNRHETQHKDKLLKCKFCEYMNKDKRNLKQHMCIHSDVKPYRCTKCDKTF